MVAGYKASTALAYYLGYLLKKIKEGVLIDTLFSWDNLDYIALHGVITSYSIHYTKLYDQIDAGVQILRLGKTPVFRLINHLAKLGDCIGHKIHRVISLEGEGITTWLRTKPVPSRTSIPASTAARTESTSPVRYKKDFPPNPVAQRISMI